MQLRGSFCSALVVVAFNMIIAAYALAQQQRYLISPSNEVIPLLGKQGAIREIIKRSTLNVRTRGTSQYDCDTKPVFGYPAEVFPINSRIAAFHKDVMGQWFISKAKGTIDTIFWLTGPIVGTKDSLILLRVHRSNIGPTYGPGIRPGPFDPPCQNWGYWVNTNDPDQGIAPFKDQAFPDTVWHSTIAKGTSIPPFSDEKWGLGGFPATMHADQVSYAAMMDLGIPCSVDVGEVIFITQAINSYPWWPWDDRTEWYASSWRVPNAGDEYYPSRNWKFYEHDSGASNCAGFPVNLVRKGWVARGGFEDDTLSIALWNWWYVMTASTNTPPVIIDLEDGTGVPVSTTSTGPQTVRVEIYDCDPSVPGNTGMVASAKLAWSKRETRLGAEFVQQDSLTMVNAFGSIWEVGIPGQPSGTTVSWKVIAFDDKGMSSFGASHSYRVVGLKNKFYYVDTSYTTVMRDITASGTPIDTADFFIDESKFGHGVLPKDDGTAGPFDIGGDFVFFGDTVRYAWIGVDGAIALSASPTDTLDVNANGFYGNEWDIPSFQKTGRADFVHPERIPPNLIAMFYADFGIADESGKYGNIYYGNDGDTCLFIVEYDQIGSFDQVTGSIIPDPTIDFRLVLNRCDNTIEFQYEDVGVNGQDSAALVGLQGRADSARMVSADAPWVYLANDGSPHNLKPTNNTGIKFYPVTTLAVSCGWNLLSICTNTPDRRKDFLYPEAQSKAFAYQGRYVPHDTLCVGQGYWLKFPVPTELHLVGSPLRDTCIEVPVRRGWNIIGSPFGPIPTSSIVKIPPTMTVGRFIGYCDYYYLAYTLEACQGYWVKVSEDGMLVLCSPSGFGKPITDEQTNDLSKLNSLTVQDKLGRRQTLYFTSEDKLQAPLEVYELPPASLSGFDARFTSGRLVESYPMKIDPSTVLEYPIAIETDAFPLTVSWTITHTAEGGQFGLRTNGMSIPLREGTSNVRITDPSVREVRLTIGESKQIPLTFALKQNYPNPFNPITDVRYAMCDLRHVSLKVYDVLGREVATLVDEVKQPGEYTVRWDASGIPSGVYFYRLTAGSFTVVKKMILAK